MLVVVLRAGGVPAFWVGGCLGRVCAHSVHAILAAVVPARHSSGIRGVLAEMEGRMFRAFWWNRGPQSRVGSSGSWHFERVVHSVSLDLGAPFYRRLGVM